MSQTTKEQSHPIRALLRRLIRKLTRVRIIAPAADEGLPKGDVERIYLLQTESLVQKILIGDQLDIPGWSDEVAEPAQSASKFPAFIACTPNGSLKDIDKLGEILESMEARHEAVLIPVRVFWGRAPDKEGSLFRIWLHRSGALGGAIWTLLALLINGRNTFLHISQPVLLSRLGKKSDQDNRRISQASLARKMTLLSRIHFRSVDATVLGPDQSHRNLLLKQLMFRPAIIEGIQKEAGRLDITEAKAERHARKYADEIVSNLSYTTVRILDGLLGWLWNRLYDGVKVHGVSPLKNILRDHGVVYIPCHRSHIDYLLLSYVLYHQGLQLPQIAAGVNLNIPLVGPLLRRGGAFFMRRSFKGEPLYSTVFSEYLHMMLTKGYSTEFFIEGGRSRTGRTLSPKVGMIRMVLESYLRDARKPLILMPVYIGYEKVFESGSYQQELQGQAKKKESLSALFLSARALKSEFGEVQVSFGTPMLLSEILNQRIPGWKATESGRRSAMEPKRQAELSALLAQQVAQEINRATTINPINLVALAVLLTRRQSTTEQALLERLEIFQKLTTSLNDIAGLVTDCSPSECIARGEKLGYLKRQQHPLGDLIYSDPQQTAALMYYRNNVQHLLALPALLTCLLLNQQRVSREDLLETAKHLYPWIKAEFTLPYSVTELAGEMRKTLEHLEDVSLIRLKEEHVKEKPFKEEQHKEEQPDEKQSDLKQASYQAPDMRQNAYTHFRALAELMLPSLERLYIYLSLASSLPPISIEERLTTAVNVSKRITLLHRMNEPEFSDASIFQAQINSLFPGKPVSSGQFDCAVKTSQTNQLMGVLTEVLDAEVRLDIDRSIETISQTTLNNAEMVADEKL